MICKLPLTISTKQSRQAPQLKKLSSCTRTISKKQFQLQLISSQMWLSKSLKRKCRAHCSRNKLKTPFLTFILLLLLERLFKKPLMKTVVLKTMLRHTLNLKRPLKSFTKLSRMEYLLMTLLICTVPYCRLPYKMQQLPSTNKTSWSLNMKNSSPQQLKLSMKTSLQG